MTKNLILLVGCENCLYGFGNYPWQVGLKNAHKNVHDALFYVHDPCELKIFC